MKTENNSLLKDLVDIHRLSNEIEGSEAKVTFGLQPSHIERIEAEFQRWNDVPPPKVEPKYIKLVWEKLGKELAWHPFVLALYYFEHLEDQGKEI